MRVMGKKGAFEAGGVGGEIFRRLAMLYIYGDVWRVQDRNKTSIRINEWS